MQDLWHCAVQIICSTAHVLPTERLWQTCCCLDHVCVCISQTDQHDDHRSCMALSCVWLGWAMFSGAGRRAATALAATAAPALLAWWSMSAWCAGCRTSTLTAWPSTTGRHLRRRASHRCAGTYRLLLLLSACKASLQHSMVQPGHWSYDTRWRSSDLLMILRHSAAKSCSGFIALCARLCPPVAARRHLASTC